MALLNVTYKNITNSSLIYSLSVGEVFKYTGDYASLIIKIQANIPNTISAFTVIAVTPGTELYTLYGHSTLVVTKKTLVP